MVKRLSRGLLALILLTGGYAVHAQQFYNIRDYGARGDGVSLDSKAINKAIEAAVAKGGGTVYVPAGNYLCGSIRLKSNLHLMVDAGAVLIAAEVRAENDYDEEEPGAGNEYQDQGHSHFHNSLIWGDSIHDVSITGTGLIWGKGLYRGGTKEKQSANKAITLVRSRNVIIRDITILHGGWFAILFTGTDNITLDNVKMDTNRDGVDVDACKNVRISNCTINAPTDDAICLKSSYGLGYARSTEHCTITNCQVSGYDEGTVLDGTYKRTPNPRRLPNGRIKFGTESNGGFKNITISNCVFDYSCGLALETVDGALLEDVAVDNITMRDVQDDPIFLRLGARMRGPKESTVGALRRVTISNVVAYNAPATGTCTISGIPGHDIEDVELHHIRIYYKGGGVDSTKGIDMAENETGYPRPGMFGHCPVYGLYVRHARNISVSDIYLSYMNTERRPPMAFDDVKGLYLNHVEAQREKGVKEKLTRP